MLSNHVSYIYIHTSTHSTCIIFIFYDPQEGKHLRQQFGGKPASVCCQTVTKSRGKLDHQLNNLNNRHYWARERGMCWSSCTLALFNRLCITLGGSVLNGEPILKAKWEGKEGEAIPCHFPALRRSDPAASEVHSYISQGSATGLPKESDCSYCLPRNRCALGFTPWLPPVPKGCVAKNRECQFCAIWGFP